MMPKNAVWLSVMLQFSKIAAVKSFLPKKESFEGEGDHEIPYLIETEEQLYALSMDLAKTGEKIYYQLANDIEITAGTIDKNIAFVK